MSTIKKCISYIKSKISPFLPISYIENKDNKRANSLNHFLGGYKNYSKNLTKKISDETPTRNYKQVIAVSGFGYSGSGAIVDLFAECDNCLTVGDSDKNTYDKVDITIGYETDFVRLSGGLFEIEKFVGCGNIFLNDALINRFVKCAESFPPFKEDERIRNCFYEFFDEIVELKIMDLRGNAYNSFLYPRKRKSNIFFLKNLTIAEYRVISNRFLVKLFNILNYTHSDYLVFDQLLSDCEIDAEKNNDYIKNVKTIIVYRDPRDIYAFARKTNMAWIAHDNVDDFILWYKIMVRHLNLEDQNNLIVQFEKLVTDYDNEIKRIFNYVEIDGKLHNPNKKGLRFRPQFSINNVGIWKHSDVSSSDLEKIKLLLGVYCFDN